MLPFLRLAKTQPLCFWQFGFITVNLTKLLLPTVKFTVLCQIYTFSINIKTFPKLFLVSERIIWFTNLYSPKPWILETLKVSSL